MGVHDIDPALASALAEQLVHWRAALGQGAERIGWKLGVGERERIGGHLAVGHLTSATCLAPGSTYFPRDEGEELHADAELAIELNRDVRPTDDAAAAREAIGGYGIALEIVDLASLPSEPQSVVVANIFHRAVAFGRSLPSLPAGAEGKLIVNGQTRASAHAAEDLVDRICAAARLLAVVDERLQAGDRIITGSIVQVPVNPGDEVVAELDTVDAIGLLIAR